MPESGMKTEWMFWLLLMRKKLLLNQLSTNIFCCFFLLFHIFSTTTATDRQPLYIYLLLVKFTIYTKCKKPTHCDREICCWDSAEKQKRGGEEWKSVDKTARVLRGKRSYCACLLSRKRDSETHTHTHFDENPLRFRETITSPQLFTCFSQWCACCLTFA